MEELTVGKVYLLRGGHVVRYQGFYDAPKRQPWGYPSERCLAFRCLQQGVSEPPAGYSCLRADVLREVTDEDLWWVKKRMGEAKARNLKHEVEDMQSLIKELSAG